MIQSFKTARLLWNAPLQLFEQMAEKGDWQGVRPGWQTLYLANSPELVRELMVRRDSEFGKGAPLRRSRILLGDGLLTSEGEQHRCQRHRIQPAFNKNRVNLHADIAAEYALDVSSRWENGTTVDMSSEMMRLSQRIVAKAAKESVLPLLAHENVVVPLTIKFVIVATAAKMPSCKNTATSCYDS